MSQLRSSPYPAFFHSLIGSILFLKNEVSPHFSYDIIRERSVIMAVSILRKTGFFSPWGKLTLMVENAEITTISDGQTVTFDLPTYPSYLSVKGDPSTAILVSDHQKYILCTHPYFLWAQIMALNLLIFSAFIDILLIKILIYILFFALIITLLFFLPRYCFKPLIGPKLDIKEFC